MKGAAMFEVGDYVIYGNNGVCRVEEVGTIDIPEMSNERLYYTLCPYYIKGCKIYTPVDQEKVVIRNVISKEEALGLIDQIESIDTLWITEEKTREAEYKAIIKSCDCYELIRMVKTIYQRKQLRIAAGKKVTAKDIKYFGMAEENLYGELAVAMDMSVADVKEYIISHVEEKTQV